MSLDNAKRFYEKVKTDQELQQKIGKLSQGDQSKIEAAIVQVAKEAGFPFTLVELKEFIQEQANIAKQSGELNDEQLAAVAGGGKYNWILNSIVSIGFGCLVSYLQKQDNQVCSNDEGK